jgi:hypothetical protein
MAARLPKWRKSDDTNLFAYSNGGTMGTTEEKKASETAERGKKKEKASKTIRGVDAEAGV